jgi:hypothetical protein
MRIISFVEAGGFLTNAVCVELSSPHPISFVAGCLNCPASLSIAWRSSVASTSPMERRLSVS